MENRTIKIKSKTNNNVRINIIPGHFATNHSHVNYYIDMTSLKTSYRMARDAAGELAMAYAHTTHIDTIICLEGTETVGAFLAEKLGHHGSGINEGNDIRVITPESNANNQLIFRDNIQNKIRDKQVLLLIASASTGKTINRSDECLSYYGGQLAGIAAIFSAIDEYNGIKIASVFDESNIVDNDIVPYVTLSPGECTMCKNGDKVDAIINSYGYSKL